VTVLSALNGYYDRLAANGGAPPYGYSYENIAFAIVLSPEGRALDVMPLVDTAGKKDRPQRLQVPQPSKRTSGVASNFLWDKTAYVLGVTESGSDRTRKEHAAFKALHEGALADTDDTGLRALRTFLADWVPEKFEQPPFVPAMRDANVVFRLDGELGYLHDRPAAREIWSRHAASGDVETGRCLATGDTAPIARLHPAVKGVYGAQSSGASIVSFNLDAFVSYGKDKGANAPVSEAAAFGYTTALNLLLGRASRNRVQIADASTVFWAEAADGGVRAAEAAEGLFATLVDPPAPDDAQEAAKVRDVLAKIEQGRPLEETDPDVEEGTRFYVLGLSPNAARLSVRFWYDGTLGDLAGQFRDHWEALRIEPAPWRTAPSVWRLLYETAAQRKAENIPPLIGGELMRAILTGGRYPRALLSCVVIRMRADHDINGMRAAICKACLIRNREDVPVSLNSDSQDLAYNLGRLFAVFAYAESSNERRNATIRDKYIGAASATPRRVFPILMRGYEHNRSALGKASGLKRGAGVKADRAVAQIIEQYDGDVPFPSSLKLEDQARFFVGYYHQERALFTSAAPQTDEATNEGEDHP
jgi:CRISPR-associated protein Csd1